MPLDELACDEIEKNLVEKEMEGEEKEEAAAHSSPISTSPKVDCHALTYSGRVVYAWPQG